MWYYGGKIHILAEERPNTLPIPRRILLTKASEHDLPAGKLILENAEDIEVFADKGYVDDDWGYDLQLRYVELNTSFKERGKTNSPLTTASMRGTLLFPAAGSRLSPFSAKFQGSPICRTLMLSVPSKVCSLLSGQNSLCWQCFTSNLGF